MVLRYLLSMKVTTLRVFISFALANKWKKKRYLNQGTPLSSHTDCQEDAIEHSF